MKILSLRAARFRRFSARYPATTSCTIVSSAAVWRRVSEPAAAMTSSSRTLPPGWMIAFAPACATTSTEVTDASLTRRD